MAEMLLHYAKKRTERSDNHMTLNMTLDEEISLGGPHNRVRNRKVSSSLSAKSSNSSRYNTVVKRNVGRREAYLRDSPCCPGSARLRGGNCLAPT